MLVALGVKNEAAFWTGFVRKALHQPTRGWVAWKVPAEIRKGLPDVWFGLHDLVANMFGETGWIELKYQPEWPKRVDTTIEVAVTVEQSAHLREARQGGVASWVLLGVADEWFLFRARAVPPLVRWTRAELYANRVAGGQCDAAGEAELRRALLRISSDPISGPGPFVGDQTSEIFDPPTRV